MKRAIILLVLLWPALARADDLGVGLYAPSAPFGGTAARLDYVTKLADHLAAATGAHGVGKVYSRAGDFAAAVKSGAIQFAVVDATYLAATGASYPVLATATRKGDAEVAWQLVSRGGETSILGLKDKKLLCPALGGRESDFVYDALLGGELARGFFAGVDSSPDADSALAALGLGRADAAAVPGGLDLPGGITVVATLPSVSWPVLVALPGAGEAVRKKVAAAALDFSGGDVLGGFRAGGDVHGLAHRFGHAARRGPMAIPDLKVTVDELVADRKPSLAHVDLRALFTAPPPLPAP